MQNHPWSVAFVFFLFCKLLKHCGTCQLNQENINKSVNAKEVEESLFKA